MPNQNHDNSHNNMSHVPVLTDTVIEILKPQNNEMFIDTTFGLGGHSKAILESCNCRVLAIDRDPACIDAFKKLEREFPGRIQFANERFGNLSQICSERNITNLSGIIFDIGTSQMQLKSPDRGFSFMHDCRLDMRMDPNVTFDAYFLVNTLSEQKLQKLIYNYSDEQYAAKIARAIVQNRRKKPILTTRELADIIRNSYGKRYYNKIDPATKTFQALRMAVNDEIAELEFGIAAASELTGISGKIIVISFHSVEDRIVKMMFKSLCCKNTQLHSKVQLNKNLVYEVINRNVITADGNERSQNRSSRSARLRAVKRIS